MKLEFSRQIVEEYSNIKFNKKSVHWKPSSSMRTDGQTDMTKLIFAFRNFKKAPKKCACMIPKIHSGYFTLQH
jgi:hypothetical protein